ncbi:MAG: cytochrome c [Phycisphaerales bacterium]|nr:cytochrome c [Phycisphaerales bacterium]MCI0631160.1 cytochrome c [Phycisphaerales bacterium]
MPKPVIYIAMVLSILAMIPPALIARTRAVQSEKRRIHLIQDMDNQYKFRAQQVNPMFADERAMRPPVPGTVARGELNLDEHYTRGVVTGPRSSGAAATGGNVSWATTFPNQVQLNMDLMRRGQDRFTIYCRPCHGDSGHGDGIVNKRAMELLTTGTNGTQWVQPKSLHEAAIRDQPVGQIFNTITRGIRTMPSYESQIPVADRWAIVAYVKALQRSQHARDEDVPASMRGSLPVIPLPPQPEEKPKSTTETSG